MFLKALKKAREILSISVSDSFQTEFNADINEINVTRAKITALVFIFLETMVLAFSFITKRDDIFKKPKIYYATMYLILILVMIIFLFIFIMLRKNIHDCEKRIWVVGVLFAGFILCWCAGISLFDQKTTGQVIAYMAAIIIVSVTPYFKPMILFSIYSSVQILFLALMPHFQKSNGILYENCIDSTTFIIISLAISYMRYKKQMMEFNSEKITQQKSYELKRLNKELEEANQKLEKLSQTDGLTGIYNRFMFDRIIESEWNKCKRQCKPLSLIMIDIDLFKAFNDNYGHLEGDNCIRQVAGALLACARRCTDTVARYGGEEFAAILSCTEKENASMLAEKIRKSVEDLAISHAYSSISKYVTISLGVNTVIPSNEFSIKEFIETTDQALYNAKKHRNNFEVALS